MSSPRHLASAIILALAALPSCEALLDSSAMSQAPYPTPVGTLAIGEECSEISDLCAQGNRCATLGPSASDTSRCVRSCQSPGDCPTDTRCTVTPEGQICLPRCLTAADCGLYSPLLCIDSRGVGAPAGDDVTTSTGVCYPDGATSGEVVPTAAIGVVRVRIQGPSNSPGLEPGRTAKLEVEIENTGSRKLTDLTSTLEAQTALLSVSGAAAGPYYLGLAQTTTVTNATLTVAADAQPGAPLPLVLHLSDGASGARFDLPIGLRVETALARLALIGVEYTQSGTPISGLQTGAATRVRLYARNVGLTSTQDATATIAMSGGAFTGALEPKPFSYLSPGSDALIAEGTLTATTSARPTITVTFSGSNIGGTTQDALTLQ